MGVLIVIAMVILALLGVVFLFASMYIAKRDDEDIKKIIEELDLKTKKGGKK